MLKLFPLSVLFVKRISAFPGLSSSHATKISFLDMARAGSKDPLMLLLRFTGLLNVFPPSVLFLNNISKNPVEFSCHTVYRALGDDAIDGNSESIVVLLFTKS